MERLKTYITLFVITIPSLLMILHPESLDYAYTFLREGERFIYMVALFIFLFLMLICAQLIREAQEQQLARKYVLLVSTVSIANVFISTSAFLFYMQIDILEKIFWISACVFLVTFFGMTYFLNDKN